MFIHGDLSSPTAHVHPTTIFSAAWKSFKKDLKEESYGSQCFSPSVNNMKYIFIAEKWQSMGKPKGEINSEISPSSTSATNILVYIILGCFSV